MARLFPQRGPVDGPDEDPTLVGLTDGDSDAIFSVLSCETARLILDELYDAPATQSEVAERLDTSIQNVSYHVTNLLDAGLVRVVDQWYSEKGTTMDVYAPASEPLVLLAGTDTQLRERVQAGTEGGTPRATPNHGD